MVPWLTESWEKRTRNPFRDSDRAIGKLRQEGVLIKMRKGAYRPSQQENFYLNQHFYNHREGFKYSS